MNKTIESINKNFDKSTNQLFKLFDTSVHNMLDFIDTNLNDFSIFNNDNNTKFIKTKSSSSPGLIKLEYEVPGFSEKDIKVELNNGYLLISGTNEQKYEEDGFKSSSSYSFSENIFVGEEMSIEDIDIFLENDILSVTAGKASEKVKIPVTESKTKENT